MKISFPIFIPFVAGSVLVTATITFGQGLLPGGEVDFENFNNSFISTSGGPTTGLISGPAGSYYFVLLLAEPNTATIDATLGGGRALDNGGWSAEVFGQSTGTPGLMNGNDDAFHVSAMLPGTAVLEQASFAVVGWSSNIGINWGDALTWWNNGNPNSGSSGYFGISGVAQDVLIGGGNVAIPTIFGASSGYIQGFTLNYYSVPEPSTFALLGLGTIALLAMKQSRILASW